MDIRLLRQGDVRLYDAMMTMFGECFEQPDTYTGSRPSRGYIEDLLSRDTLVLIVAQHEDRIVGGLAAYELRKFEQERSEFYVYDLAVDAAYRRQGIATAIIGRLQEYAAERGAYVIFIQADRDDDPAIALYSKLGTRAEVLHFDIPVSG